MPQNQNENKIFSGINLEIRIPFRNEIKNINGRGNKMENIEGNIWG